MDSLAISTLPSPSLMMNWDELEKTRIEVRLFLKSLNPHTIGQGFVFFNQGIGFALYPRGWIKQQTVQWILSRLTKGATFEATQMGFILLGQKIDYLAQSLKLFNPTKKEECTLAFQTLWQRLLTLNSVVENIAVKGLRQLCENYRNAGKYDNATSLDTLGKKAFVGLQEITKELTQKLLEYYPALQADLNLEIFKLAASKYIRKRNNRLRHIRGVIWTSSDGVCLPHGLVINTQKDIKQKTLLRKTAIQNAACLIELPKTAQPILVPGEISTWIPLRPICSKDTILFEDGVTGTCERTSPGQGNLFNVYYKLSRCGRIVITTSAIDSPQKAQQIAHVINLASSKTTSSTKKWRLHSLNSFYSESPLLKRIQYNAFQAENHLCELISETSIVHINTAFNSATAWDSTEDPKSLNNINCIGLASLACDALEKVEILLVNTSLKDILYDDEKSSFSNLQSLCSKWLIWIQIIKSQTSIHLLKSIQTEDRTSNIHNVKDTNSNSESLPSSPINPREKLTSSQSSLSSSQINLDIEDELNDDFEIVKEPLQSSKSKAALPDIQPENLLSDNKDAFVKELYKIYNEFNQFLIKLKSQQVDLNKEPQVDSAILIIEVLLNLLALQMKHEQASRCTEIELFLLFDRLLGISTIISCYSGLDRTGGVAAFDDALSYIEEEIYQSHLQLLPQDGDYKTLAQAQAYRTLFNLIVNLDENRKRIFKITNQIISSNPQIHLLTDLSQISENIEELQIDGLIRNKIIEQIEQQQPLRMDNGNIKLSLLKYTFFYLELVSANLLGPRLEITHTSCAVPGLKYHLDTHWIKRQFMANPHAPERWPPLLFTPAGIIQLFSFTEGWGWWSDSFAINQIAIDLFCRLSQCRPT